MKKSIYVLRDELSGEVVNVFLAHNDDVAKVIIERAIDRQPLFGKMSLYKIAGIDYTDPNIICQQLLPTGRGVLIATYKPNDKKRKK